MKKNFFIPIITSLILLFLSPTLHSQNPIVIAEKQGSNYKIIYDSVKLIQLIIEDLEFFYKDEHVLITPSKIYQLPFWEPFDSLKTFLKARFNESSHIIGGYTKDLTYKGSFDHPELIGEEILGLILKANNEPKDTSGFKVYALKSKVDSIKIEKIYGQWCLVGYGKYDSADAKAYYFLKKKGKKMILSVKDNILEGMVICSVVNPEYDCNPVLGEYGCECMEDKGKQKGCDPRIDQRSTSLSGHSSFGMSSLLPSPYPF
ncbi:MAG: hypothetical protein KBF06_04690 [Bacteroidales bacterium]|jgi:hypothetical protein|nr:hypothetical protein [Bacteroidales bacterium]MDI9573034.1 hypothetical protein [Bacteroidota bacterium]HOU34315.1 hypothetical protein [Bacteroidales bacterium]HQI63720.1 hypothetical protein [Bacteroidales bacterium]HUM55389.1 hypothetical protein [Bacteroidales bacterium]